MTYTIVQEGEYTFRVLFWAGNDLVCVAQDYEFRLDLIPSDIMENPLVRISIDELKERGLLPH